MLTALSSQVNSDFTACYGVISRVEYNVLDVSPHETLNWRLYSKCFMAYCQELDHKVGHILKEVCISSLRGILTLDLVLACEL